MRSFLPRSLSGQLALVMAGALLVASVVNFVLLLGERQRAALIEQSVPAIARFVDVASAIFDAPPEPGRQLSIGRPGPGRYQVQAGNPVDKRELSRDADLEHRLAAALREGGVPAIEVRASTRTIARPERGGDGPGMARGQADRPGADMSARPDGLPGPDFGPELPPPPLNGEPPRPPREAREIILSSKMPDGRWLTSFSISPEATSGDAVLLGASTFVIFGFVLAAALWIASRVARPLRDLTEAAQRVGAAGEPHEVIVRGPGDVRQTLEAFNTMSRRVSQLLGEKDVMLGALGHDLRTPLSSLRIRIESMEPESERQKAIKTIEEAAELLEDILELARQGRSKEPVRTIDIAVLVEDIAEDYSETGAPVVLVSGEKGPVACRPVLFRRALRNLIDNAIAYGERARLSVTRVGNDVRISVEDDGPGMSSEALASAADPFYRGDASRNRSTGGAGLGLTLADAIAKAHRGKLIFENRAPRGLTATIILPAAASRPTA